LDTARAEQSSTRTADPVPKMRHLPFPRKSNAIAQHNQGKDAKQPASSRPTPAPIRHCPACWKPADLTTDWPNHPRRHRDGRT